MATARVATAPMKVAQVPSAGAYFQIVEREIPRPGAEHVRIKVQACGVCHSDVLTKEGEWPGIQYPRVPGHEVAGVIDELGAGVSTWAGTSSTWWLRWRRWWRSQAASATWKRHRYCGPELPCTTCVRQASARKRITAPGVWSFHHRLRVGVLG